jgi:sugar phosphate isomerase/epimerase
MSPEEWVDRASVELDVDGLEFYWEFVPREPSSIATLRRYVESRGLCVPMMCYSSDFTMPGRDERDAEVEQQKRAIEVTAAFGGKFCRVLSGQRRPGIDRDEGIRMVAECINACIPFAESHGVTLILENHYKDAAWRWPEFAQKEDVFLEVLDLIPDSPWFGANFDPSNALVAGTDPLALLDAVKHRVVTMHASDRFLEGGALADLERLDADEHSGYASILNHGVIGRGLNDYDAILSTLKAVGFQGWISIEDGLDPESGMDDLRLSAEFLRTKMAEHGLS